MQTRRKRKRNVISYDVDAYYRHVLDDLDNDPVSPTTSLSSIASPTAVVKKRRRAPLLAAYHQAVGALMLNVKRHLCEGGLLANYRHSSLHKSLLGFEANKTAVARMTMTTLEQQTAECYHVMDLMRRVMYDVVMVGRDFVDRMQRDSGTALEIAMVAVQRRGGDVSSTHVLTIVNAAIAQLVKPFQLPKCPEVLPSWMEVPTSYAVSYFENVVSIDVVARVRQGALVAALNAHRRPLMNLLPLDILLHVCSYLPRKTNVHNVVPRIFHKSSWYVTFRLLSRTWRCACDTVFGKLVGTTMRSDTETDHRFCIENGVVVNRQSSSTYHDIVLAKDKIWRSSPPPSRKLAIALARRAHAMLCDSVRHSSRTIAAVNRYRYHNERCPRIIPILKLSVPSRHVRDVVALREIIVQHIIKAVLRVHHRPQKRSKEERYLTIAACELFGPFIDSPRYRSGSYDQRRSRLLARALDVACRDRTTVPWFMKQQQ